MKRLLLLPSIVLLVSCGAGGDSSSNPDGGTGCELAVSVENAGPILQGEPIVARAVVDSGGVFFTMSWAVSAPDLTPLEATPPDGTLVEIETPQAGSYEITATATLSGGGDCADTATVNVQPGTGASEQFRLRFVPPPGAGSPPPQDGATITVFADTQTWTAATQQLIAGRDIAGTLWGPSGALSAYLRISSAAGTDGELFADELGLFTARVFDVPGLLYDLLVVPYDPTVAPDRLTALSDSALSSGLLLDAGEPLTGVVLTSAGTAVPGATVAVAVGDLPATLATTAVDGTFTAAIRPGGALSITVVPPAEAGLARLAIPDSLGLMPPAAGGIELRLPDVPAQSIAARAIDHTGAPLAGARVTFVSSAAIGSGTITIDGVVTQIPGKARITAVSDAAGDLPAILLPASTYDVVVDPVGAAGEAVTRLALDLTGAPPPDPTLQTEATTSFSVRVTAAATGVDVVGARIHAVPRTLLDVQAGRSIAATSAGAAVDLELARDLTYDLVVIPPRGAGVALARRTIDPSVDPGITAALRPAIELAGTVLYPSGAGQPGVRVEAYCVTCMPADVLPSAETTTSAGGEFVLSIPAPAAE